MHIDLQEIEKSTGLHFDTIEQLYFYTQYIIEFLKVHNKNYTKKQYDKIDILFEFMRAIKLEEREQCS